MKITSFTARNGLYIFAVLFTFGLSFPLFSEAQTVVRVEESVSVSTDQLVEGNFYSVGNKVSNSGEIQGDWFALGSTVTNNGTVSEDALVIAGTVQFHGSTSDDVRILAGEAVVADRIGGNLTVVAGSVKVLSSAHIEGDVLLYANDVEIVGSVGGTIMGRVTRLRIDGEIGGDVDIKVNQLTLGDRAQIEGDVLYESTQEIQRAQNSVVAGQVNKRTPPDTSQTVAERAQDLLIPLLVVLFTALSFYLIWRQRMMRLLFPITDTILLNSLIGFGVLLFTPLVIVLFFVSILGSLVGGFLLITYLLLLLGAIALSGPFLGILFGRFVLKRQQFDPLAIFIGCLILFIMVLVPILGPVLILLTLTTVLGGLARALYHR